MKKIFLYIVAVFVIVGCQKEDIDKTPPSIDAGYDAFPLQCDEIKRGETFNFRARFTDDTALGSYGIDIHNNFNQHNHSTEVGVCHIDPLKSPVKPYVLIKNYEIPEGLKFYEANVSIDVPEDVDTGDYHFVVKVTDKAGWQTLKGISVKIVE